MRNLLLEAQVGPVKKGIFGQYFLFEKGPSTSKDGRAGTEYNLRLVLDPIWKDKVVKVRFLPTERDGKRIKGLGDQVRDITNGVANAEFVYTSSAGKNYQYAVFVYEEREGQEIDYSNAARDQVLFTFGDGVKFVNPIPSKTAAGKPGASAVRTKPALAGEEEAEAGGGDAPSGKSGERTKPELGGGDAEGAPKKEKDASPTKPSKRGEGSGAKDVPKIPPTDRMRGGDSHEGGTPEGWQNIITLDDPEGDRTGQEYGDPRYRSKEQGGLGIGDYEGPKFRYEAFIDPSVIKTQKDLVDDNKPSVYFRVSEDNFDQTVDQTPKSSRDFNFTGLEVWSDGTWSGTKPDGISNTDLSNLRFTFEELWNSLKDKAGETSLPPGGEPPATPPVENPDKPPGEGGGAGDEPAEIPKGDDTVEGGGIDATLGDRGCCHTPSRLFYSCYSEDYLTQGYPNGLDSSDEKGFYAPEEEYSGSVNRFSRGIEKKGSGWRHFIYTVEDRIDVFTEGNNLLDYNSPRTISKIRIRLGNGSYSDSASNPNGIAVLLPILRRIILDVRIFLPQRDDCGIPDDRIPAITNFTRWTSGGMNESYELEIRNRVRQILQGSYRS